MKYVLCILFFAVNAAISVARAEEAPIPDVTLERLSSIREKLGCQNAGDAVAKLGCTILLEFSDAGKPDPQLLKTGNRIGGRRWVGVTVVLGEINVDRKELPRKSPYINLIVLGARYSGNFHQKLWYQNGYAPIYIWPERNEELVYIKQASESLLRDKIDEDNPAIQFARSVDLKFSPVKASVGKSLLLGNSETFLRQRDSVLYVIEMSVQKSGNFKYWLSRVYLNHELEP